jgi:hypothetical protein
MVKSKVSVGLSTVTGLLASLAGFAAAVAAYKQGDRSEATVGTIAGGAVGVISLVTTLAGRYAQAVKLGAHSTPAVREDDLEVIAAHVQSEIDRRLGFEVEQADGAEDPEGEPEPLSAEEAYDDPGMGDPLDASPESFQADVRDKKGGGDAV